MPAVRWRLLAVAGLLVLAGCGAAPGGEPDPTATVTPAPVPTPADRTATGPGGPGLYDDVVDGRELAIRHADTLTEPHTRYITVRVEPPNRTRLYYLERRTIAGNEVLWRRSYEGPGTGRFVPNASNVTSAREIRYEGPNATASRQFVEGQRRAETGRPFEAPDVGDDAAAIAVLLDNATVTSHTDSPGFRVAATGVDQAAVPDYLTAVSESRVRASVRPDGRVTRLRVRYEARLDGRPVTVTQVVRWTPPTERDIRPAWADG